MWLRFKTNKDEYAKVNLEYVQVIYFLKDLAYLCFRAEENDYMTVKREYNDNFDEIVDKLMGLQEV